MRNVTFVGVCLGLIAAGGPSFAQSRDPATAEALFRQGRQAMEAKNYSEACPRFAESQKLDPAPGTLMNLATCEEQLGKLASAWQHWKEAIDALPAKDDRIAFARGRVDDLEKKLPRLKVVLVGENAMPAHVFRDDVELGPASRGTLLPVDPGSHEVTVRQEGHLAQSVTVSINQGEEKELAVHPGPIDPHAQEGARNLAKPPARTLGWVVTGAGALGLATAAVTGLLLVNKKSKVESTCPAKTCTDASGVDAAASGKTLLVANTVSWGVAALGLGVGAYLLLRPTRPSSPAVIPSVALHSASLSWVASF